MPSPIIFVFGSNLAGFHGAGAAEFAFDNHGAVWGQGEGYQGQSYAIPTKEADVYTSRSLDKIRESVNKFMVFARENPRSNFLVTQIGCGYAGYKRGDIAPLFNLAPSNCFFSRDWFDEFTYAET